MASIHKVSRSIHILLTSSESSKVHGQLESMRLQLLTVRTQFPSWAQHRQPLPHLKYKDHGFVVNIQSEEIIIPSQIKPPLGAFQAANPIHSTCKPP